jgi:transcriptional regulator with XRE-family HTH domain
MMTAGKTIRVLRFTRNLSQGKLARALGVSAGYLSLVERDKRDPSLGFLRKVASYFNMPVGFLLLGDGEGRSFNPNQRRLLREIRHTLLDYFVSRQSAEAKPTRRSGGEP